MAKCAQRDCDKTAITSWGNCKFHWGAEPPQGKQANPELVPVVSVVIPDQVVVRYTPECLCTAKHCIFDGKIKADDSVVLAVRRGQWTGLIMHYPCAVAEGLS